MICDRIENFGKYRTLHRQFEDVALFLESEPLPARSDGRHSVNNDGAYVVIEEYQTQAISDCFIECHRKYIDVQVMIQGVERMGVGLKSDCAASAYDPERDFQKLEGPIDLLSFREGSFMIFYPEDAHMPKVRFEESASVRKAVFKVPA